ncbi:RDD family protein [uncultured Thiothrix sp.]|uniref:RDD family protein n=1 Tax=uncultured Thiothrix sp. TaxID=223185 RepID=UPI00262A0DC5|nr:RDD family protein [uncultured Thiothrix sp.]
MRLDTTYTVNTPEGIALELSPAGPVPRTLAWLVDLMIRAGVSLLILILLAFLGSLGMGLAMILIFLLEWFYPVWFELRYQGQTPGKRLLNIYVAQLDASPISPAASVVRNLLRVVDFLPFFYGFGLASTLLTKRFQRLGDLAANTVVLHKSLPVLSQREILANPEPANVSLSLPEQQALILFAQREATLTIERQQELAQFTESLVKNKKDPAAHLRSIASWLIGKQA